ncbi:glutaredoxin family protein [Amphibiibacter pelophylacis]|uniref:DUF4124 domain-containing protein n=1 Tax=Amphibiibacter pelophylacis TaxID=1799477 RepID=A0ACC6NZR7_9BURK
MTAALRPQCALARPALLLSALLLTLHAPTALAQYRVVGPDGRVTYTDQPQTREQVQPPAAPSGAATGTASGGDTSALSRRNVLVSPGTAAQGSAVRPASRTDPGAPQGVAGRDRASALIRALNSSQPLDSSLSPAQIRAIISGDASTEDIASGAAGRALNRLPPAPPEPGRTLGQDRLLALGADSPTAIAWPAALRQVASQQPVVLYTNPACSACAAWLDTLRQRGVPAAVFTVSSPGDFVQLQRLTGQDSLPVLTLAGQVIATAQTTPTQWIQALDQAGYTPKSGSVQPAAPKALGDASAEAQLLSRPGAASQPSFVR